MRYSQNNEQDIILEHFKNKPTGRFLDIGAYDGKTFSNTLALVENGWTGLCIEPSPSVFCGLLKLHGDNPNVTLINAALSDKRELIPFYDCGGDAVSSTSTEHVKKWSAANLKFTKFNLITFPLSDLFAAYGYAFDFINLDVEGKSADLFFALPLDLLAPNVSCFCIEHDMRYADILSKAEPHGFKQAGFNGENIILTRS